MPGSTPSIESAQLAAAMTATLPSAKNAPRQNANHISRRQESAVLSAMRARSSRSSVPVPIGALERAVLNAA